MSEKKVIPLLSTTLEGKILSEGYCCMRGYLKLCAIRGEKAPAMAKWIGMHRYTIYYHYRLLAAGKHICQKSSMCLGKDISGICD